jgi:hypothetical protein
MLFGTDHQTTRKLLAYPAVGILFTVINPGTLPISVPKLSRGARRIQDSPCMVNLTALVSASRARLCDLLQGLGALTGKKSYRQVCCGDDLTIA